MKPTCFFVTQFILLVLSGCKPEAMQKNPSGADTGVTLSRQPASSSHDAQTVKLQFPEGGAITHRMASQVRVGVGSEVHFQAQRTLFVSSADDTKVLAWVILKDAVLSLDGRRDRSADAGIEKVPLLLNLGPDGLIHSISGPKSAPPDLRVFLANLSWASNFVIRPGAATWSVHEQDLSGQAYTCTYSLRGARVHKTRAAILPAGSNAESVFSKSEATGIPGPVWLDSFDCQEAATLGCEGSQNEISSSLSMEKIPMDTQTVEFLKKLDPRDFSIIRFDENEEDPSAVVPAAFASLDEGVQDLSTNRDRHGRATTLLHALAERMRQNPAEALVLAERLASGEIADPGLTTYLMAALEITGTPESSQAIHSLINDNRLTVPVRVQAISASDGVQDTQALFSTLTNVMGEHADNDLGEVWTATTSAIRRLSNRDPGVAAQVTADLRAVLAEDHSSPQAALELKTYLRAAPASDEATTEKVRSLVNDPSTEPSLQSAASDYLSQSRENH